MLNSLFNNKLCLHDKAHVKKKDFCEECAKNLNQQTQLFGIDSVPTEFRALYLTVSSSINAKSDTDCWFLNNAIKNKINGYKIKNLMYGFYKGDIGNKVLKTTCNNPECLNPYHMKSRFEPDQITKRVRVGFSRKYIQIADLTYDQWLRH